jgi:hypothetical protein
MNFANNESISINYSTPKKLHKMVAAPTTSNILTRAINVYALPKDLLDNLVVRSIQAETPDESADQPTSSKSKSEITAGALRCQACPDVTFETLEDQREHFKSDWHRYNVKARLTGRAVSAEEWEGMVEGKSIPGLANIRRIVHIRL